MNPEQILAAIQESIRSAVGSVPGGYIESEPDAAWRDIASRFIIELARNGITINYSKPKEQPKPRLHGPRVCQENLNGVGPCVLSVGHTGQHRTHMGDKWG